MGEELKKGSAAGLDGDAVGTMSALSLVLQVVKTFAPSAPAPGAGIAPAAAAAPASRFSGPAAPRPGGM
jgi:hypothetical protein